jgi:hypothetical protein
LRAGGITKEKRDMTTLNELTKHIDWDKQEELLDRGHEDLREVRQAMIRFEQLMSELWPDSPRNQKHLEELREAWWQQAFHFLGGPRRDELVDEVTWYVGPEDREKEITS